jgi:hypothetical protein
MGKRIEKETIEAAVRDLPDFIKTRDDFSRLVEVIRRGREEASGLRLDPVLDIRRERVVSLLLKKYGFEDEEEYHRWVIEGHACDEEKQDGIQRMGLVLGIEGMETFLDWQELDEGSSRVHQYIDLGHLNLFLAPEPFIGGHACFMSVRALDPGFGPSDLPEAFWQMQMMGDLEMIRKSFF